MVLEGRQNGEKVKRDAMSPSSPVSSQTQKRQCINERLKNIAEEQPLIDKEEVLETVMRRVNTALKGAMESAEKVSEKEEDQGTFLAKVMTPFVTAIATAITTGVAEVMNKVIKEIHHTQTTAGEDLNTLVKLRRLTYDNDRLEQYTRRENIRIFGVQHEAGESTESVEKKALEVMNATGASVSSNDISACHRVGGPRNGSQPIIVRFVSRKKRAEVMKKKRHLKDQRKQTFITDDLTGQRLKLFHYVKDLNYIEKVWTVDGKIFCVKKTAPGVTDQSKPIVIENADDLFKLGEDTVDWAKLGLSDLGGPY